MLLLSRVDASKSYLNAALFRAVQNDDVMLTTLFLMTRGNVHTTGLTPLHYAVSSEIASLLIKYGTDPFAVVDSKQPHATMYHGNTVLHSAFYNNAQPDLVQYFLNIGIPINAQNNRGETALHILCSQELLAAHELKQNINILINAGADPLIKDNQGYTPWDRAVLQTGHIPLWKAIINDYLCIRDRAVLIKQGMRTNGFFAAPPEVMEQIALMASSAEVLEQDTCDIIVRHQLWTP